MDEASQLAARLEAGRLLFARECRFVTGTATLDRLVVSGLPEVAFIGRSNVGKSSLLNSLTGRNGLARTSNTPGRTQEINFFDLADRLMLVDLPGYGFASAPKDRIAAWTHLVNHYLKGRVQLRRTLLLVDARHGLKDNDREMMTMLDKAAVPYQLVLTKVDKIKAGALAGQIEGLGAEARLRPAAHPDILATSSEEGTGLAELRAALALLALPAPLTPAGV